MSNQPIKPLERNIAIGAVIAGLASFPFILGQCKPSDLSLGSKSVESISIPAVTTVAADNSDEISKLQNELEQAYGHVDVAQAEMTDARNAHYALQEEFNKLKANQAHKTSTPVVAPVAEVIEEVKPAGPDPKIAILAAEIARLKLSNSNEQGAVDDKIQALTQQLNAAQKANKNHKMKIDELNKIISKDDSAQREQQINKAIAALREENTTLRRSETKLKADATAAEKTWNRKLKNAGNPYKAEIEELKGKLALLKAQSVFATSSDDLDENAGKLFKKLQSLENQNSTQLAASYKAIEADLKSQDMTRVKFGTGSVSLDQRSQNQIDAVLKDIKPTDSFLIVGYASNQGDKKLNERLSSNRAKAVADRVLSEIGSDNTAKAVYLGETTRFGEIRENQCVELWKISK